jgi:hypothetical protein
MNIEETRRGIPVSGAKYDVIVCGGGPAGLGAAHGAATHGARTLLLEARTFFGGVAQVGLWMPMNRMFNRGKSRGGVHEALVKILDRHAPDSYVPGIENHIAKDGLDIHPDYLRLAAYELLEEAGCDYRFFSPVSEVLMEGDRVRGVAVASKEGRCEFYADVVIDCTGDADVAHWAGVPTEKGREGDGRLMPISLSFALSNVDAEVVLDHANDRSKRDVFLRRMEEARQKGYAIAKWYFFDKSTVPGTVSVNNGGPHEAWDKIMDGTKTQDLNVIDRMGVKIAVDFVRAARELKLPGLENCSLMRVSPFPGVRETRRVVGEYVMQDRDAIEGTRFEDAVVVRYGDRIDSQNLEMGQHMHYGHQMPWRCLVPLKAEGLLVAGRCASATQIGATAGRSMGNMMAMGQAAGVGAAQCVQDRTTPRKVDPRKIREKLKAMKLDLGD